MKRCHCVIGANYGDEGKGRVVDQLAREIGSPLVCRFSSGPQAGHTVVTSDGRRHVFSHVGSGSFLDCITYLAADFLVNPLILEREMKKLDEIEVRPKVVIHPLCKLTTIYDVAINAIVESRREVKHGSCLMGINETMQRAKTHPLYVKDALGCDLSKKLRSIFFEHIPMRLKQLGISYLTDIERIESYGCLSDANQDFDKHAQSISDWLTTNATIREIDDLPDNTIFEGSQGLGLDMEMGTFPHVTHARVGYSGISQELLNQFDQRQVTYVTRAYLTRHGNGPMETSGTVQYEDDTNVANKGQGSIRFAPLNAAATLGRALFDSSKSKVKPTKISVHIGHVDQQPDVSKIISAISSWVSPCEDITLSAGKYGSFIKI